MFIGIHTIDSYCDSWSLVCTGYDYKRNTQLRNNLWYL